MLRDELQVSDKDLLQISNDFLQKNVIDLLSGGESNELFFRLKDADQALKCASQNTALFINSPDALLASICS